MRTKMIFAATALMIGGSPLAMAQTTPQSADPMQQTVPDQTNPPVNPAPTTPPTTSDPTTPPTYPDSTTTPDGTDDGTMSPDTQTDDGVVPDAGTTDDGTMGSDDGMAPQG